MSLVAIFGAVALAGGAYGLNKFKQYQGTGVNKSPLQFIWFEAGSISPVQILKFPRQLDHAVTSGDIEKIRELLEAEANPNLTTHFSGPALLDATNYWHIKIDLDIIKLLVKFGADVNQPNIAGTTPLHKVISAWDDERTEEAFRYFLSQDADTYAEDNNGDTPRDLIKHHGKDNLQKILDEYDAARVDNNSVIKPSSL